MHLLCFTAFLLCGAENIISKVISAADKQLTNTMLAVENELINTILFEVESQQIIQSNQ